MSNLIDKQKTFICPGRTDTAQTGSTSSVTRDLFTEQTGEALIALGKMFVNVPPFNDHIDQNTGRMLISIGKKLKRK